MATVMDPTQYQKQALAMATQNSQMEEMLVPAPKSIALLAQLMLVATSKDFELELPKDKDGKLTCTFVKYKSFRASLVQVGNFGYTAFQQAHKNMGEISLHAATIPDDIQAAMSILMDAPEEIEWSLQSYLDNIMETATTCTNLAMDVEKKFADAIALTGELLEICVSNKGDQEAQKKLAESSIEILKKKQKIEEDLSYTADQQFEHMQASITKAEDAVYKALEDTPTSVEIMSSVVDNLSSAIINSITLATRKKEAIDPAVVNVDQFTAWSGKLLQFFTDDKLDMKKILDEQGGVLVLLALLQVFKDDIKGSKIEAARDLVTATIDLAKSLKDNQSSSADHHQKAIDLDAAAVEFTTALRNLHNLPHPTLQVGQAVTGGSNYQFKVAQTKEILAKAQADYAAVYDKKEKAARNLQDLLDKLAAFNIQELEIDEIRRILSEGIKALTEVREQWVALIQYFGQVTSLIKVSIGVGLTKYVKSVQDQAKRTAKTGLPVADMMKKILYSNALNISAVSYQVQLIASTYVEISGKHFVQRVGSLQKLIVLDPDTEKEQIKKLQREINEGCVQAQEDILRKSQESREKMQEIFASQMAAMDAELHNMPKAQQQAIEQGAKKTHLAVPKS